MTTSNEREQRIVLKDTTDDLQPSARKHRDDYVRYKRERSPRSLFSTSVTFGGQTVPRAGYLRDPNGLAMCCTAALPSFGRHLT